VLLTWVFAEACKGPIGPLTASHIPSDPALRCSTACTPLAHAEVPLRQRVKCITDANGYAIYFSRGVLPHNKDGQVRNYPAPWHDKPYLLHLGLQCYDRAFLKHYSQMAPTPLQVSGSISRQLLYRALAKSLPNSQAGGGCSLRQSAAAANRSKRLHCLCAAVSKEVAPVGLWVALAAPTLFRA
jgi:hypothetical protein